MNENNLKTLDDKQIDRLATIVAGLAASGHYTYLTQKETGKKTPSGEAIFEDVPSLRDIDYDSCKSDSFYHITNDALVILKELETTDYTGTTWEFK